MTHRLLTIAGVKITIASDLNTLSQQAADPVVRYLRSADRPVLGLAAGDSVSGLYDQIAEQCRAGKPSLDGVRGVLLDEYVGFSHTHPQSFFTQIKERLVLPTDWSETQLIAPWCDPDHPESWDSDCRQFEQQVRRLGVGLQILGIGSNGHLGFNEPGSEFTSVTRVVRLSEQTRSDNSKNFRGGKEVPSHAVTQGLSTILAAERWLLIAMGEVKALAVAKSLHGPITEQVPGSLIQKHGRVHLFLDTAAASQLKF